MDSVTSLSALSSATSAQTATSSADSSVTGDFETFLSLLTAQLRNQDPLQPVDSTEFVAQLASFSSVEQQVETNTQLQQLVSIMSDGDLNGLASWIGTEIRVSGPATYSGTPLEVALEPISGADQALIEIRNDFGQVVATRAVSPSATEYEWNGLTSSGELAPEGSYTLTASYLADGVVLGSSSAQSYVPVSEILVEGGVPILVAANGTKVGVDSVTALRPLQ